MLTTRVPNALSVCGQEETVVLLEQLTSFSSQTMTYLHLALRTMGDECTFTGTTGAHNSNVDILASWFPVFRWSSGIFRRRHLASSTVECFLELRGIVLLVRGWYLKRAWMMGDGDLSDCRAGDKYTLKRGEIRLSHSPHQTGPNYNSPELEGKRAPIGSSKIGVK